MSLRIKLNKLLILFIKRTMISINCINLSRLLNKIDSKTWKNSIKKMKLTTCKPKRLRTFFKRKNKVDWRCILNVRSLRMSLLDLLKSTWKHRLSTIIYHMLLNQWNRELTSTKKELEICKINFSNQENMSKNKSLNKLIVPRMLLEKAKNLRMS